MHFSLDSCSENIISLEIYSVTSHHLMYQYRLYCYYCFTEFCNDHMDFSKSHTGFLLLLLVCLFLDVLNYENRGGGGVGSASGGDVT